MRTRERQNALVHLRPLATGMVSASFNSQMLREVVDRYQHVSETIKYFYVLTAPLCRASFARFSAAPTWLLFGAARTAGLEALCLTPLSCFVIGLVM